MELVAEPHVDFKTLLDLKVLLKDGAVLEKQDVIEDQHYSSTLEGDADATKTRLPGNGPAITFSSPTGIARMADVSSVSQAGHDSPIVPTASEASGNPPHLPGKRKGG